MGRKTRAETSLKGVVTFIIVLRIFAGEIQTILIHAIENPIREQKIRCIDQSDFRVIHQYTIDKPFLPTKFC